MYAYEFSRTFSADKIVNARVFVWENAVFRKHSKEVGVPAVETLKIVKWRASGGGGGTD